MRRLVSITLLVTAVEFATSLSAKQRSSIERTTARATPPYIKTYKHNGWTLSYRFQPASRGYEREKPVVLVHPVGIGINSWFWERFMEHWTGPAVYAPDLIGCGIANGGDKWDPNERGLSFPLGWVQGVESLIQQKVISEDVSFPFFGAPQKKGCIILAQGGLAPVGIMLAARNPSSVSTLVLTSPPTWKDVTTAVPAKELYRNFNFLSSSLIGPLAFGVLESRWAVEFFSKAFLFQDNCDERWLELACSDTTAADRPPVAAFNAGFCNHRSFEGELIELSQPTLVLCGNDDQPRTKERVDYVTNMQNCVIKSINGKNVLPWEAPAEVVQVVKEFCYGQ